MNARQALDWSFSIGRWFGIEVRCHWTLFLPMLFFSLYRASVGYPWWAILAYPVIVFVSVLCHEFGHALAARAVGGDCRRIIMWALGGLAMCTVPQTPLKRFTVSAAGPMVTVIFTAVPLLILRDGFWPSAAAMDEFGIAGYLLGMVGSFNLFLLIFNLIPCYPLDGGQMLRAMLWPVFGLRRAQIYTIYIAYLCLAGFLVYAVTRSDLWLTVMVVIGFFYVHNEHRILRQGFDPYNSSGGGSYIEVRPSEYGNEPSWWDQRQQRKARDRREKEKRQEGEAEAELDRLLAKVSEEGLPSLSKQERAFLERYSKQRRET